VAFRAPRALEPRRDALLCDEVERLLTARLRARSPAGLAVADAAQRIRALDGAAETDLCIEELVSRVLCDLCVELDDRAEVASVVDAVAERAGQDPGFFRFRLAPGALGAPQLLDMRQDVATQALLTMVSVLAPVTQVSLWEFQEQGEALLAGHVGEPLSPPAPEALGPDDLLVFPVATGASRVVLVTRVAPEQHVLSVPVLERAASALGAVFARSSLLERCSGRESSLSEACERRLVRLGLDLHDGPLQNVAGITGDLKLLRHRLEQIGANGADNRNLLGSVGDLEARLAAIDTELRDLSHSLESPAIAKRPFAEVLSGEVDAFRRRCDISLALELSGELTGLTASQRIALVRIVQESLSNIREHSCARDVRVTVCCGRDRLVAEIVDDGCGFDVAETLLDAGRRGRLGLVGVSERARLLGGSCEIQSRPGGPTTVAVELPRWRPDRPADAVSEPEPGARLVPH
jgi:signal transduction histidine kinase